jgi:hypothetical protein
MKFQTFVVSGRRPLIWHGITTSHLSKKSSKSQLRLHAGCEGKLTNEFRDGEQL